MEPQFLEDRHNCDTDHAIDHAAGDALRVIASEVIGCCRCPRLVDFREEIGRIQRRAYRGEQYWSKPVPGFGDYDARILIIGLAPGAHGANRTGRVFTGDKSGEFLYRALWQAGFANQSNSSSKDDGLVLHDVYISAAVRCVPPDNKPTREEILNCRPFLLRELSSFRDLQIVVVLGGIALDAYLSILQDAGHIRSRSPFRFGHGATYKTHDGGPIVLASYHPSQQNTSTKKLTAEMLLQIFLQARSMLTTT